MGIATGVRRLRALTSPRLKRGLTADQIVSGCTADIQSGRFSGTNLAVKFNWRGFAYYYAKSQYDRAIEDYDQARVT